MLLGQNLRTLRRAANLTQVQLSHLIAVGQAAISKWERGKSPIPSHLLPTLARVLGTTLNDFLAGLDDEYDQRRTRSTHEADAPRQARQHVGGHAPHVSEDQRQLLEVWETLPPTKRAAFRALMRETSAREPVPTRTRAGKK